MLFWSGCAQLPLPGSKPTINESLPGVDATKVQTLADMASVGLEWKPVNDLKVQGYVVYRGESREGNFTKVAVVKGRYASHTVDLKLSPQTNYYYRIATIDSEGRESMPSGLVSATTLPPPEAVPWVEAIGELPKQVKIIWRPHPYPAIKEYLVLRNDPTKNNTWQELAVLEGRLNAEYIDAPLEDGMHYQYRILARTFDGVLSKPSSIVEALTRKKPERVSGLMATQTLPKRIVLTWKGLDQNLSYYQIYRSSREGGGFEPLTRTVDLNYTDQVNRDGVTYFYKVTAVDSTGLESVMQDVPVLGATKSRPKPPKLVSTLAEHGRVTIRWQEVDDRPVRFTLIRSERKGFKWEEQVTKDLTDRSFVDDKLVPGVTYRYRVIAIDDDGLASDPSEEAEVVIKPVEGAK